MHDIYEQSKCECVRVGVDGWVGMLMLRLTPLVVLGVFRLSNTIKATLRETAA